MELTDKEYCIHEKHKGLMGEKYFLLWGAWAKILCSPALGFKE